MAVFNRKCKNFSLTYLVALLRLSAMFVNKSKKSIFGGRIIILFRPPDGRPRPWQDPKLGLTLLVKALFQLGTKNLLSKRIFEEL